MAQLCTAFLLILLSIQTVYAAETLTSRAQRITQTLNDAEQDLTDRDYRAIHRFMTGMEEILSNYENASPPICASNGEPANLEKFAVHIGGKRVGGWTKWETCKALLANQKNGLVCLSDGDPANLEEFVPYSLSLRMNLGQFTKLPTCMTLVARSTPRFVCVSDGDPANLEDFFLFDLRLAKKIGSETKLETCLRSIPNQ